MNQLSAPRRRAARLSASGLRRVALVLGLVGTLCEIGLSSPSAAACTAFSLKSGADVVVAKNYDWDNELGVVLTNKRGVRKTGLLLFPGSEASAQWVSRYASLTFNQYGREMPNGGMNEKGLVVEVLWLADSKFPKRDARAAINELQWVQYQLDNFASTSEVLAAGALVRVSNLYAPVHYFVCDASGACGTFEFIDGQLVTHFGHVLTNDTYADSQRFAARFRGLGGAQTPPAGTSSLARFVRAKLRAQSAAHAGRGLVKHAFETLDAVAQGDSTKWQIVYEPARQRVHFRTRGQRATKTVTLHSGKAAGSCSTPVMQLDLATASSGDATGHFRPYTAAGNAALVKRSFARLGAAYLAPLVAMVAALPASMRCTSGR